MMMKLKEWIIELQKLKLSWIVNHDIAFGTNEEVGEQRSRYYVWLCDKRNRRVYALATSIAHHLVRYASTLR